MFRLLFGRKKYIYGLRKLGSEKYVYVGQCYCERKDIRLLEHIKSAKAGMHPNKELQRWILQILKCDCNMIVCDIFETVHENRANLAETLWIQKLKREGHKLFNIAHPLIKYGKI